MIEQPCRSGQGGADQEGEGDDVVGVDAHQGRRLPVEGDGADRLADGREADDVDQRQVSSTAARRTIPWPLSTFKWIPPRWIRIGSAVPAIW